MQLKAKWFLLALAGIVIARLFSMAAMPLIDTSEPRYAEIARLMAETGDWITPWFEPGVPFWGKPPLSFWSQAMGIRILGGSEFAVRLPSFLAMVALAAMLYRATAILVDRQAARWTTLILSSMLLPLAAAGAVLTDSFLALGITYSMLAFLVAPTAPTPFWRYGFFVGIAIGLLSKGPLAFVLLGIVLVPWLALYRDRRAHLTNLPWLTGTLLMVALTVPWYIVAEIKTPGFVQYFLVGEHFLRFLDSGWQGDLYGTAHERPFGGIWGDWLLASFPWGWGGILLGVWIVANASRRARALQVCRSPVVGYLALWAVAAPAFFTFSGNILWTYVLPSLPAFALLLAIFAKELSPAKAMPRLVRILAATCAIVPIAAIGLGLVSLTVPTKLKTEKQLVAIAESQMSEGQKLYFVHSRPFSARFYSRGTAELITPSELEKLSLEKDAYAFVAIPKGKESSLEESVRERLVPIYQSRRYALYRING
ncbi:glycosyltransferase family 39 protein [Achromobacter sp. LC458]|uniref:Dolichyl-phosphate-mannose-protein mannosyltransferase n=2 Tax=Achromobacter piechaudii TaxID=72556 RepID=D4X4A8_9BURK|nr:MULTISPECIES: glycosyltransferase family 39 protein [Achromobacter]EFF78345.1 dolichyl-phosphate-mannose-protein mannosyltransferase [Achromobacter piechaudii ATCC 43553]MDG9970299.1 glycosyltransferase family 39 protein [Achromobacter mucicolens]TRM54136.1 glycosyltransferase family 39 protein [Achromobacter sp. LC458]GLK94724.1 phospholipid carrier-dependent glycosyltransferase [Achromobacter xylosoxidans]